MEDLLTETLFFIRLCYVHLSNQHLSHLLGIMVVKALTSFSPNHEVLGWSGSKFTMRFVDRLQKPTGSLLTNSLHCLQIFSYMKSRSSCKRVSGACICHPKYAWLGREKWDYSDFSDIRENQAWGQLKCSRECCEETIWTVQHREIFL